MSEQRDLNTTPVPRKPEVTASSKILDLLASERLLFLDPLKKEIPLHEGGRICEFLMEQLVDLRSHDKTQTPSLNPYMDHIKEALYRDHRLTNIQHLDYKFGLIVTRLQELVAQ